MMKAIKYIFLAFLSCTLLSSCSEDLIGETGIGNITGVVVFEGDNTPLENVKVSTNPPSNTVFTEADGSFDLGEVITGSYSVQAEKMDLITAFEPATVTEGNTTNVIFELQPETANNVPPTIPVLLTPEDGAEDVDQNVTFTWTVTDPDPFDELMYELELRTDLTDEVQNFRSLTDTFLTVNNLTFSTKYFWQVTVSDDVNPEVNSEFSSFTTVDEPNNRVVFTREVNGNNVIFSTDDGSSAGIGTLQLTSNTSNSFRPRRNVEIGKIAYLRTVGGETQLFTMNEDGSENTQITSSQPVNGFNLEEVDFAWEPNGSKIYFPSFDKLFSINSNGGGLEQIYATPDGSFITEIVRAELQDLFVIKTNDVTGYNAEIIVTDLQGNLVQTVLSGFNGAAGGIDISFDGNTILYTRDLSQIENPNYRQLNTHIFTYNLDTAGPEIDLSTDKIAGTNDLDPKFSPTDAQVIFVNTPNDEISERVIFKINTDGTTRESFLENAIMPDWQ